MQFNVLSCFQEFYIATFCTFFDFYVQLFTAIFIKYCAKCKSVVKTRYYKTISVSSMFFDCMKKSYMTDQLRLNAIYDETVGLQARSFTTPANSALQIGTFDPFQGFSEKYENV